VKTYFLGHYYQHHGFNIQAIIGHLGRFLYVAVAALGGQPDGYVILGDNAYKPSEYFLAGIFPTLPLFQEGCGMDA
jgi:hypothetical protein